MHRQSWPRLGSSWEVRIHLLRKKRVPVKFILPLLNIWKYSNTNISDRRNETLYRPMLWSRARGTPARRLGIRVMALSGYMTSSVTSPFDYAWPLSYRLPIVNYPLSLVVSDIIVTYTNQMPPRYTLSRRLGNSNSNISARRNETLYGPIIVLGSIKFTQNIILRAVSVNIDFIKDN